METLIIIFTLTILVSCNDKQIVPKHSDVFRYVDKKTNDTIKFYGYTDIDTAICYATKENKNILVVFSAPKYFSMPQMDWQTLSYFKDKNLLHDKFIILCLKVDDSKIARDTNQVVFWYGKARKLITIGDQNKYFEEQFFKSSTQPLFGFMDINKKPFGKVLGYSRDKVDVEVFVNSGLKK